MNKKEEKMSGREQSTGLEANHLEEVFQKVLRNVSGQRPSTRELLRMLDDGERE